MGRITVPTSLLVLLTAFALVAGACSDDSDGDAGESTSSDSPSSDSPSSDTLSSDGSSSSADDLDGDATTTTVAAVAQVDDAPLDWGIPTAAPPLAVGALGFDRYVWSTADDGEVIPVVVEGPRGRQFRCQDPDRVCSYQDLRDLAASGDPVPADLGMTGDELQQLVAELDEAAGAVNAVPDPAAACAAGYEPVSAQNPNMGVHFVNGSFLTDGFVIDAPEMLLFASEDGFGLGRSDLGSCTDDGGWDGIDSLEVVGAAYFIDLTDEHPDGFAGPLDQWHVHYNSCAGGEVDSTSSEELCEANGGSFFEFQRNWMMHTYVADGFDSQTGVFAMWNDSIWPTNAGAATTATDIDEADNQTSILDFSFENLTVQAGESIGWINNDEVPHTIAAGSPGSPGDFLSDPIGTGGAFALTFDEPGIVPFFCSLHPTMTGNITVQG